MFGTRNLIVMAILKSFVKTSVTAILFLTLSAAYPTRTRKDFQSLTDSLKLWNGENYGHKQSQNFVTIVNTCF
jgi:hypothetical protein